MIPFIRKYPRFLFFGVMTAAFSGPGQTFLVALFIPHMRDYFAMSQTEIALWYSLATLLSAVILPLTGKFLDRLPLLTYTLASGILLATGCLVLAQAYSKAVLFLGFFLIRNLGQGTMTMISSTTMARIFGRQRGKALGISNIGFPLGEAIFPLLVSIWILHHGWRAGWGFLAGLILFLFIPSIFFLLFRNHREQKYLDLESAEVQIRNKDVHHQGRDWSVSEVIRDWRFHLLLFPLLIPPAFFTALFFHQAKLVEWKGWEMQIMATGFIAFGVTRAAISFFVGPMVDRFTARRIYPINLIPLGIALLFFLTGQQNYWGFFYLGFAGMTMGLSMTVSSALYAELYGLSHLGSIRGIISSLIVLATAIAPVAFGALLDYGSSPEGVIRGMILLVCAGCLLAWTACREEAK